MTDVMFCISFNLKPLFAGADRVLSVTGHRSVEKGRPKVDEKPRQLIRKIGQSNPLWGAPSIHCELLEPGFKCLKQPFQSTWFDILIRRHNRGVHSYIIMQKIRFRWLGLESQTKINKSRSRHLSRLIEISSLSLQLEYIHLIASASKSAREAQLESLKF